MIGTGYRPIPQHFLNFLPLPHGQGALRPGPGGVRAGAAGGGAGSCSSWWQGSSAVRSWAHTSIASYSALGCAPSDFIASAVRSSIFGRCPVQKKRPRAIRSKARERCAAPRGSP